MRDPYEYPKLRWPIDIQVQRVESQEVLLLHCPLGISEAPLGLNPGVGPLLACFEGQLSVAEIHQRFAMHNVTAEIIRELIEIVDCALFLESPAYFEAVRQVRTSFRDAEVRAPALAGISYASDSATLEVEVDQMLIQGNGIVKPQLGNLLCLISPHIDYHRGGRSYGTTYNRLKDEAHDLYILIGTSHQHSKHLFHLSRKHFDTPLGTVPCETAFVDALAKRYGQERSFADEYLHRQEHSLELQLPFLKRIQPNAKIVPILVGGFLQMLTSGREPHEFDEYESFAASLAELIQQRQQRGERCCIIAGVDMAHVGKAFGDSGSLSPEFMQLIQSRDQHYLEAIRNQDKKLLFRHIAEDNDARKICGYPTMYTVIDVLDRLGLEYHCEIFDYYQAVDYEADCGVTFAGAGLYQTG